MVGFVAIYLISFTFVMELSLTLGIAEFVWFIFGLGWFSIYCIRATINVKLLNNSILLFAALLVDLVFVRQHNLLLKNGQ